MPERVPGSGIVWSLAKRAAQKKWRLYLLGGAPGSAVRAAEVLKERYKGLEIAGTSCPEMGFDQDAGRMEALREEVAAAKPDETLSARFEGRTFVLPPYKADTLNKPLEGYLKPKA